MTAQITNVFRDDLHRTQRNNVYNFAIRLHIYKG